VSELVSKILYCYPIGGERMGVCIVKPERYQGVLYTVFECGRVFGWLQWVVRIFGLRVAYADITS